MNSGFWTVIVAAGRSARYGAPKLLEPLGARRVIDHSVATAVSVSDGVVLVADDALVSDGQPVDVLVRAGTAEVPRFALGSPRSHMVFHSCWYTTAPGPELT